MTNADKFKNLFGVYATELWSMPEKDFLKWLNSEVMNCSEIPNNSDLISRQAAIDAIANCTNCENEKTLREYATKHSLENGWTGGVLDALDAVKDLPPAQPEPHEGYWIRRDCGLDVECKCSKCGYRDFVEPRDEYWFKRNYCPNCGAKMKGERQK